jgi:hypothetical protein
MVHSSTLSVIGVAVTAVLNLRERRGTLSFRRTLICYY